MFLNKGELEMYEEHFIELFKFHTYISWSL